MSFSALPCRLLKSRFPGLAWPCVRRISWASPPPLALKMVFSGAPLHCSTLTIVQTLSVYDAHPLLLFLFYNQLFTNDSHIPDFLSELLISLSVGDLDIEVLWLLSRQCAPNRSPQLHSRLRLIKFWIFVRPAGASHLRLPFCPLLCSYWCCLSLYPECSCLVVPITF